MKRNTILDKIRNEEIRRMYATGRYSIAELAHIFHVSTSPIYDAIKGGQPKMRLTPAIVYSIHHCLGLDLNEIAEAFRVAATEVERLYKEY